MMSSKTKHLESAVAKAMLVKPGKMMFKDDPISWLLLDAHRMTLRSSSVDATIDVEVAGEPGQGRYLLDREKFSRILEATRGHEIAIHESSEKSHGSTASLFVDSKSQNDKATDLVVRSAGSEYRLPWKDPGDYPEGSYPVPEAHVAILASDVARMVRQTLPFTDDESVRYAMSAVVFRLNEGSRNASLVATDGRRLAISSASARLEGKPIIPELTERAGPLIPGPMIRIIGKLAGMAAAQDDACEIRMGFQGGRFVAEAFGWSFSCRMSEGRFPNYTEILNNEASHLGVIHFTDRDPILMAAQLAAVTTCYDSTVMSLHYTPDHEDPLVFTSYASDIGSSAASVFPSPDRTIEKGFTIGYKADYLIEALKAIPEGQPFTMTPAGVTSPTVLSSSNYIHAIMPATLDRISHAPATVGRQVPEEVIA
jgi:DNA polymerase III sliding clamp (beta) subunit (PCNA family)